MRDARTRTCLLGADPLDWVFASAEPEARWQALTGVLGRGADDPDVMAARAASVAGPTVRGLLDLLSPWEVDSGVSGHDRPLYAPNLVGLLADMGVRADDGPRIEQTLDAMLAHQDENGRFQSLGRLRSSGPAVWGTLLCDNHAVTETLLRYGRGGDSRVGGALEAMKSDLADLVQGRAWPCRPEPVTKFRGPGRKTDFCPLVTLEGLRAFSHVPESERPPGLMDVARVSLRAWREWAAEKPYMFGHGRRFKRVKWPATWYNSLTVLDAVGRYPELWTTGADADGQADLLSGEARTMAEIAACLIAYNVDPATGTVTPRSCYQGFERFSFGRKKQPSPFATARVMAALARVTGGPMGGVAAGRDLTDQIAAVDVRALPSSKGGTGTALGP